MLLMAFALTCVLFYFKSPLAFDKAWIIANVSLAKSKIYFPGPDFRQSKVEKICNN